MSDNRVMHLNDNSRNNHQNMDDDKKHPDADKDVSYYHLNCGLIILNRVID